jgi:hypothetical protein
MPGSGIGLRINCHRIYPQGAASPDNPQGNLAPVGDENFIEQSDNPCFYVIPSEA